jgi:hypothetical protein
MTTRRYLIVEFGYKRVMDNEKKIGLCKKLRRAALTDSGVMAKTEAVIVGLIIGFVATKFGGEGKGIVDI